MARMIDADALIKAMGVHTYMQTEWTPATAWGVPIVDAEPVVRCKDCKHNYHNMIPGGEAEHGCTKCIELPITADFFCSRGERREDEQQE